MRKYLLSLISALLFCTVASTADEISPEAETYVDAALAIMQQNFLHKDEIDWAQLNRDTLACAGRAETTADTYPAIRLALRKLGDNHSYLQLTPELARKESSSRAGQTCATASPTQAAKAYVPSPFQNRRVVEGAMVPGSVPFAQVVVPSFSGPDPDGCATRMQATVAELAAKNPCGWIVDLRGNGGGNMWPMLVGVGPILGEGNLGTFLNAASSLKWFYREGRSGVQGNPETFAKTTAATPVRLKDAPLVAVITDRGTGSSGEIVAIAFRGRPDTRFFGETTFGAASATSPFKLSDGAQIYLVVSTVLNREGNEYPTGVRPDEAILSDVTTSPDDPVVRAASEWLSRQQACRLPSTK
jgi:carboxyl-terminal processing protease